MTSSSAGRRTSGTDVDVRDVGSQIVFIFYLRFIVSTQTHVAQHVLKLPTRTPFVCRTHTLGMSWRRSRIYTALVSIADLAYYTRHVQPCTRSRAAVSAILSGTSDVSTIVRVRAVHNQIIQSNRLLFPCSLNSDTNNNYSDFISNIKT